MLTFFPFLRCRLDSPSTRMMSSLRRPVLIRSKKFLLLAGAAIMLVAVLIAMNLLLSEQKVEQDISHLYGISDPQFERSLGMLLGPSIVEGNRFTSLQNGEEIFPAMLEAIASAQKTITFETYIYWSDEIGRQFSQALAERARAGVKVHVLIDWVGSSKMDDAALDRMRAAGVEVRKYHPLRWYNLSRMNNRTHRKLLVVDGRIGFTGGVGIAEQWTGNAQDKEHWRDAHFQVEGPVVAQMQAVLVDNWINTTGKVLHGPNYFPPLEPVGKGKAQVFSSSPRGGNESMHMMYLLAITAAEHSIHLSSAYFVPDELTIHALIDAVRRGVRVQVIVPGTTIDTEIVRQASRGLWGDLLQAGVEIYEYQPTMFHSKVLVLDEQLVSVGSTNFDIRSLRLNDEANLNIYDKPFAREQIAIFNDDLAHSKKFTFEQWQQRPLGQKIREKTAAILRPLL